MELVDKKNILGNKINIYGSIQEPLFNANEISKIIENKNVSQMLNSVDDDEKELITIFRKDGSSHKQWYLKEEGLYEVLMISRKAIAKEFKRKIKEILKTIRKKGGYIYISETDNEKIIEQRISNIVSSLKKEIMIKNKKLVELESFYKENKELASIEFLSNKYELSRKEFLNKLKEAKFIYQKGKNLYLYRNHKYKGYIKYFKNGNKNTIRFTPKGEKAIKDIFINLNIESSDKNAQ